MNILKLFENRGIELAVNTETKQSFMSLRAYSRLSGKPNSTIQNRASKSKSIDPRIIYADMYINNAWQNIRAIPEDVVIEWLIKDNPILINQFISTVKLVTGKVLEIPKNIKSAKSKVNKPTHLYVIQCTETKVIKIGISSNPERRLKSIQTSYPYELNIVQSLKRPSCKRLEKLLHKGLADFRLNGEWFDGLAYQMINWELV